MLVAYFPRGNKLLRAKLQIASRRPNFRTALPSLLQGLTTSLGTNESIRDQVARLIALGVSQTTLAKRMGLHLSWFNRWINDKGPPRVISVAALDGFAAYLTELATAIQSASVTTDEANAQVTRAARRRDAREPGDVPASIATAKSLSRPRRQRR
jgi:hypothetical protein